jgi:hypothetical protein
VLSFAPSEAGLAAAGRQAYADVDAARGAGRTEGVEMSVQDRTYIGVGVALALAGMLWVLLVDPSNVQYDGAVEGISLFAVLYVIAQGAERITEWIIDGLSLLRGSPEKKKEEGQRGIRAALIQAQAPQQEEVKKVNQAKTALTFLGHGISFFACVIAVNALNFGILRTIGAQNVSGDLDRFVTALAAAGGGKALHELVGRLQTAKEAAATG